MYSNQEHPELNLLKWLASILSEQDLSSFEKAIHNKPGRITNGYKELFQGYEIRSAQELMAVTEDLGETVYQGLVSGLDIPFLSFCEHHFLPFFGTVDIIYEPGEHIIGIGKLSRLVDYRTKKFNIQERIAEQLCSDLMEFGLAKGAFARVKAQHMCLCYRGPKKYDSNNVVCYWGGTLLDTNKQQKIDLLLNKHSS